MDKNDLQNITQKIKDQGIRTPRKPGCDHICFRRVSSSCSKSDMRRVILVTNKRS